MRRQLNVLDSLRVLLVTQHFSPERFLINGVVKDLLGAGVQVSILTGVPNYPSGSAYPGYSAWTVREEWFGSARVLRVPHLTRGNAGGLRLAANYITYILSATFWGQWRLRRESYDVVFVFGTSPVFQVIPAIALGWVKRTPVVLWVQDLWPDVLVATGYRFPRLLVRLIGDFVEALYRSVDLILAQSPEFQDEITRRCGSTPVIYHPNPGPHLSSESPVRVPEENGVFEVVFAGNIGRAQGLDSLIEAAIVLVKSDPEILFSIRIFFSSIEGILNPQLLFPIPHLTFFGVPQVANNLLKEFILGA